MSGGGSPDFFYREALRLGYVARSAFKILRVRLPGAASADAETVQANNPGDSVLDLGCAPGAWLQVACQSLGPAEKGGVVVGIDVKKVKVPNLYCDSRVRTACADVMTLLKAQVRALSPQLGARALSLAIGSAELPSFDGSVEGESYLGGCSGGVLRAGGNLVIKLLESEDNREFAQFCKPLFKRMSWTRPKATRSSSREIYLVCQGLE
ncbi:unnamed protein product [Spirodela intermedia]|uniref:rRNA methyltransferase 2, mitochondrial n=1 Tax=Spirodela intermedia TaxID=51605 RepID=A0A7I8JGY2_SPIIN|nr:unnamed protein product [Spirodela intermedia]CAA6669386.1 unnamed protein product [Spirodela intermedia]